MRAYLAVRLGGWLLLGATLAEGAARVQDRIRFGTPLLASADREAQLQEVEWWGRHGRPNGHYRRWSLDESGFQSSRDPTERDCPAWITLGASETFGYAESPGRDWPAQLQERVRLAGNCRRVLNAAMPGMGTPQQVRLAQHWLGRVKPTRLLYYPSPAFYAGPWTPSMPDSGGVPEHPRWRAALLDRLPDIVEVPGPVQRWRVRRWLGRTEPGAKAPELAERLTLFTQHLDSLSAVARLMGSELVVLTHANRQVGMTGAQLAADKEVALRHAWRVFCPTADDALVLEFERAFNARILEGASAGRWRAIDVAAAVSGRPEYFADMVHFTDAGATRFVDFLSAALDTMPEQAR